MAVSLAALIISSANPEGISRLRALATDVAAPVIGTITRPVQDAVSFVGNASGIAHLQAENAKLVEENAKLREWYQAALLLDSENKSLRELLNVKLEPQNRYITSRILADSGNTFVKSLILSSGKKDGVRKGQAVLSGAGLVGRVIEAGTNASRVLLVTDINSRVPVIIEDSRQHAIMAGENDASPLLTHIPSDSQITAGARVITSGQGGIFPPGLPVGRAIGDEKGGYAVELFADFDRLIHVRVIDRPDDPNLQENEARALD